MGLDWMRASRIGFQLFCSPLASSYLRRNFTISARTSALHGIDVCACSGLILILSALDGGSGPIVISILLCDDQLYINDTIN
jgi:hypothetical protein